MAKNKETPSVNELSNMSAETEGEFDVAFAGETAGVSSEKAPEADESSEKVPEKELKEGEQETSEEEKPKEEIINAGAPKEDFEHKWKTLQGEFGKVKEEKDSLKSKIDELQTKQAEIDKLQEGTKAQQAEAEKKKSLLATELFDLYADLTPEEKAELASYDDEFDVVSKTETRKRVLFEKKIKSYISDLIESSNKSLLTNLAPFLMASEKNSEEAHFTNIRKVHPDFEKYRDDGSVKKWIAEQPAYLRTEMQKVYNEGESEDVVDLFSRFKKENNIGTPVKNDTSKKDEQLDPEKKEKLENMEVVDPGKRAIGAGGGGGKAKDFDGAFDEATAASK